MNKPLHELNAEEYLDSLAEKGISVEVSKTDFLGEIYLSPSSALIIEHKHFDFYGRDGVLGAERNEAMDNNGINHCAVDADAFAQKFIDVMTQELSLRECKALKAKLDEYISEWENEQDCMMAVINTQNNEYS